MSSLRRCALQKASSKQRASKIAKVCKLPGMCKFSRDVPAAGSSTKMLTQKHLNTTQKSFVTMPDCSEERVHRWCVGEAQEGLCGFLDTCCEEDAVGGPANGVGNWLFGKFGVKVPQVAGATHIWVKRRSNLLIDEIIPVN